MGRFSFPGRANVFDMAVAGFAAGAFAFAALALPEWRLTQFVLASGLPDLVAAAEPPLGLKARFGAAALVGLGSFAALFALLRALDRRPRATEADETLEVAPIRLRRADAHPDAPPRRPLAAGRELGEPAELLLDTPAEVPDQQAAQPAVPVEEPQAAVAEEPEAALEPAVADAPEPAPLPEPEATEEAAPLPMLTAEPVAERPEEEESIGTLMQRLESGLSRRERKTPVIEIPSGAPEAADPVGHRLRSAISDLQKLAARG